MACVLYVDDNIFAGENRVQKEIASIGVQSHKVSNSFQLLHEGEVGSL